MAGEGSGGEDDDSLLRAIAHASAPMPADGRMALARSRIGTTLRGKYRLDALLGVGGMAAVYAATHRNQAQFAIKMLHPEISLRQDVRVRFLREGYAANSVKHPGVVLVVDDDVAEEDGAAFLVMELLEGMSIEGLWQRCGGILPVRAVLAIGLQVLDVLSAAHPKGIVHRDIKPGNLFATYDGRVKLLDFGIARARDAMTGAAHGTESGLMLGTPAFMAPEQALGNRSEVDGQTDLWAVGATLFSLLTGEFVHVGQNAQQLMIHSATKQPQSLATLDPDLDAEVVGIVDRALAYEKALRWETAALMRDAIRDAWRRLFGSTDDLAPLVDLLGSTASASEGRVRLANESTVRASTPPGPALPPLAPPSLASARPLSVSQSVSSEPRPAPNLASRRAGRIALAATAATVLATAAVTIRRGDPPVRGVDASSAGMGISAVPSAPSTSSAAEMLLPSPSITAKAPPPIRTDQTTPSAPSAQNAATTQAARAMPPKKRIVPAQPMSSAGPLEASAPEAPTTPAPADPESYQ